MAATILTLEDLQDFKQELLEEIKAVLSDRQAVQTRWVKSHQVRRMLTVSPGTLQHLRVTGVLPFTKIGGVLFYDALRTSRICFSSASRMFNRLIPKTSYAKHENFKASTHSIQGCGCYNLPFRAGSKMYKCLHI